MSNVVPFLNFAGQAAQAMKLYEKAFGAKIIQKLTYADMNPADAVSEVKDEYKEMIGYSEVEIRGKLFRCTTIVMPLRSPRWFRVTHV